MKWLEALVKKYPSIQSNYEQSVLEEIRYEKNKIKKNVAENRWWEIHDIDSISFDLPDKEKSRIRKDALDSYIIKTIKEKRHESIELNQIMSNLEEIAQNLNDNEKKEMEILFLEGLINVTIANGNYNDFYSMLGPTLRKMCDENNAFWQKVSV
jgi:hypothetical protein